MENQTSEIDDVATKKHNTSFIKQMFGNIPQLLMHTNNGMVAGYSAILLPQLENENDILQPTKSEESWIASLAPLPMALGCIFSGLSMDYFGRKLTIILASVIAAIGWITIYFSANIKTLLIGRILTGLAVGYSGVCMSSFIGEITHPKYRGFFLNSIVLGISIGTLIVHFLGTIFYWRVVALITTTLPVLSVLVMGFIPESHIWYINKNRLQKAQISYVWFRGSSEQTNDEFNQLIYENAKVQFGSKHFINLLKKCNSQRFIKPFLLLIVLFSLSQCTGNNAIVFYSVRIMENTIGSIDKYTSTLAVDALRVFMSGLACALFKKYKVRYLALNSGVGTTVSLLSLSLFIYLATKYPQNQVIGILPLFSFMTYIIFISIGLLPLSWALLGEILPPETKGIGAGLSATINFLMFFVIVKTSPDLMELIGLSGTFAIYGVCTMVGTVLLYFFLPETRGKTLNEIQEIFVNKKRRLNIDIIEGAELKVLNENIIIK